MKHWSERLACQCGLSFRTVSAEARHRHNFPILCRRSRVRNPPCPTCMVCGKPTRPKRRACSDACANRMKGSALGRRVAILQSPFIDKPWGEFLDDGADEVLSGKLDPARLVHEP